MTSPFPGMDPYLEDPSIWHSFHTRLATELADQLTPQIVPNYYADVELQTVSDEISLTARPHAMRPDTGVYREPDAPVTNLASPTAVTNAPLVAPMQRPVIAHSEVKLRTVRIYITETDQLVTTIEILSPYNKRPHRGLNQYRRKRNKVIESSVHLVEIDLLRGGTRPGLELDHPPIEQEYILLVNRDGPYPQRLSDIWPVGLNESLPPKLPVPLLAPDTDVEIDLRAALDAIYERAAYQYRIDYSQSIPPPTLRDEMVEWLKAFRQEAGLLEAQ
ncbi:MAG: DUF4058 family protein [Chloroflexota bacterium]